MINQYAVYWVDLNPTKGAEINKVRPCVIISPVEMNDNLKTVIIAPVTSAGRDGYPTRTSISVGNITGWIVLHQIRAIDKTRLCDLAGQLSDDEISALKSILVEMLVD
ncbi:MAG TPA: type II toxin-antitoxin system PemK/MazF family toxin [Patescibacteria group bacterium]|nr:type II toxin-antitoxin system PemK/MazF family toxin [Patescibacteria group bacterium]